MKHVIPLLATAIALAACDAVPYGGEGETSRGEPLVAEAKLSYDGNNEVIISSANGWTCKGAYSRQAAGNSTTRRFPLTCNNGATGNAIMAVNNIQHRATVAFSLSNGVKGKVAFGLVS